VQQLRQPRDVDGDPAHLIVREHLCLSGISLGFPTVEIRDGLPGGIADDIAARYLVGAPGRELFHTRGLAKQANSVFAAGDMRRAGTVLSPMRQHMKTFIIPVAICVSAFYIG
jgi:hypothetical protein